MPLSMPSKEMAVKRYVDNGLHGFGSWDVIVNPGGVFWSDSKSMIPETKHAAAVLPLSEISVTCRTFSTVGAEVVGAEVVGAEVVGAEVVGAEVVGVFWSDKNDATLS